MSVNNLWLAIKALITLFPLVYSAIRDGRIRAASQDEVLNALVGNFQTRLRNAEDAAREALALDEDQDPYNRSRDKDA